MEIEKNTKIRIRLESFDYRLLVLSYKKIINTVNQVALNSISTVSLPTSKRIYCVLRSPHVDKDSREHFEIRAHKRMLEISYNSNISIFDLLTQIDLPAGIFYRICLL